MFISGAGAIGLMAMICCHAKGAGPLTIADVSQKRLALAKRLIPSVNTYLVDVNTEPLHLANDIVSKHFSGIRPFRTIECSGAQSSVWVCIYTCNKGGKIQVIGQSKQFMEIPIMHLMKNQVRIQVSPVD